MLFFKKHIAWFLSLLSLSAGAQVGYPNTFKCQYHKYNEREVININSMVEDERGFLWISSQDGVFRFDSKSFVRSPVIKDRKKLGGWASMKKLVFNNTTSDLFAISSDHGIAIRDKLSKTPCFTPVLCKLLADKEIMGLLPFEHNFIVSTNQGLISLGGDWNNSGEFEMIAKDHFNQVPAAVCKIDEEHLALLTQKRELFLLKIEISGKISRLSSRSIDGELKNVKEFFEAFAHEKTLYYCTDKGLIAIVNAWEKASTSTVYQTGESVYAVTVSNGEVIFSGKSGLYRLLPAGQPVRFMNNANNNEEEWLSMVYSIQQHDTTSLWLGTQNGLALCNLKPTAFTRIIKTADNKHMLDHVYQIGQNNKDIIISSDKGLFAWKDQQLNCLLDDQTYFLSFTGPAGELIASDLYSTCIVKNKKKIPIGQIYPEFRNYPGLSFNDVIQYKDGNYFLSTENEQGVFLWNPRKKQLLPLPGKNKELILQNNGLFQDGPLIYILTDSLIYSYDPAESLIKKIVLNEKGADRFGLFFDMVRIGDHFYIASYGNGVLCCDRQFKITGVINSGNGLVNDGVYRLINVGDTDLFISTNNGIDIYSLGSKRSRHISEEDGLHNNTFEEFSSLYAEGFLYFGGKSGVTRLDPSVLARRIQKGNLQFLDFTIINSTNSRQIQLNNEKEITIPNDILQTRIDFQNISYPYGKDQRYRYRIRELNEKWIENKNQNFITLIGISPGTYHLEIEALDEYGLPFEIKELTLVFLPKWYQTWWFRGLVLLFVLFIAWILYRIRIQQIRKEENIRNQVAADLHDELGSTLNSVKVFANLASMEKEKASHLEHIKESTQQAISGLRDIIWVLDDKRDTLDHLQNRIRQFAEPISHAAGIQYEQVDRSDAGSVKLGKEEKRNLYLIIKEAINNSIKYGGQSPLSIQFSDEQGRLCISIRDQGPGFDTSISMQGYGLKNMRRRANEIKFQFDMETAPGAGTRIILKK